MIKRSRVWITASFVCTFRMGVVYAEQYDTSSDCCICFRYDLFPILQQDFSKSQKMERGSYKKLLRYSNIFENLDDLDDQSEDTLDFLGIANTCSFLILKDICDFLRVKLPFHIGWYVDAKLGGEWRDLLGLYFFEGVRIDNIVVVSSLLNISKRTRDKKEVVGFKFVGNYSIVSYHIVDLKYPNNTDITYKPSGSLQKETSILDFGLSFFLNESPSYQSLLCG